MWNKLILFTLVTILVVIAIYTNTLGRNADGNLLLIIAYIFFILVALYDIGSDVDGTWPF